MPQPSAEEAGLVRPQSIRAQEIQAILHRNQEMMQQLQRELDVSAAHSVSAGGHGGKGASERASAGGRSQGG